MKQLLVTLLFLLLAGPLAAQQGLAVNELFSGNIIPRERMVETRVQGTDGGDACERPNADRL